MFYSADSTEKQSISRPGRSHGRNGHFPLATLRIIFASQARLLADRAECGLGVDVRSLRNLLRVAFALAVAGRS
jgi:hypothetical protein